MAEHKYAIATSGINPPVIYRIINNEWTNISNSNDIEMQELVNLGNAYDADQSEIKRLRAALEKASMELNFIKFDGRHDSKLCRTKAAQQQMSPCLLCEIEQLFK